MTGVDAPAFWVSGEGHRVRPAREEDALRLAPRLRAADVAEIQAASGAAPEDALRDGIALSRSAYAITHRDADPEDAPLALFGVADHPAGPEIGAPWLLAHRDLPRIARALYREAAGWIDRLAEGRAMLSNCVDARNTLHIRWLRLLDFRFVRRIDALGPESRPFFEFVKLTAHTGDPSCATHS